MLYIVYRTLIFFNFSINLVCRRIWAPHEDEAIKELINNFGSKNWTMIAEHILSDYGISGRTGKLCRERWHNHLGKY